MAECNNDTNPPQKAKLSESRLKKERELGSLRDQFSEEELAALDKALLEPMSEEESVLWYDAPILEASAQVRIRSIQ